MSWVVYSIQTGCLPQPFAAHPLDLSPPTFNSGIDCLNEALDTTAAGHCQPDSVTAACSQTARPPLLSPDCFLLPHAEPLLHMIQTLPQLPVPASLALLPSVSALLLRLSLLILQPAQLWSLRSPLPCLQPAHSLCSWLPSLISPAFCSPLIFMLFLACVPSDLPRA